MKTFGHLVMTCLGVSTLLPSCGGDTGQPFVETPLVAVGTPTKSVRVGTWDVTLSTARIGLGPLVFCASRAASDDLCPRAQGEWADVANIDALAPNTRLGTLRGLVGTVRSASYDLAITWLATETRQSVTRAAPDGHSVVLVGEANSLGVDKSKIRFRALIDIVSNVRGQRAVSTSGFDATLDSSTQRVEVALDANTWVSDVDFDELARIPGATTTELAIVNEGETKRAFNAIVVEVTSAKAPKFRFVR